MNLEWFLDVDEFMVKFVNVFFRLGLDVFNNYNKQNVFNQTARFISGSCRMFS